MAAGGAGIGAAPDDLYGVAHCNDETVVVDQYCGQDYPKPNLHLDVEKQKWDSFSDYRAGIATIVYVIDNHEGSDANMIKIIAPASASGKAGMISILPLLVGSIAQGDSDTFKLQYRVEAGVTSFTATIHATAMTDDGNTHHYPGRVTAKH